MVSALGALETNLIVFGFSVVTAILAAVSPPLWHVPVDLVGTSILKSVYPLVTTLANFVTVRSVCKAFVQNFTSK
jgi:hypothetical protein